MQVEDIYKLGVLKFVYKQQNNLLHNVFSQFYIENASIHSHNTTQSHGLHVINPTNKFGQCRLIYQGTFLWKSIPAQLWSFHLKTFSKKSNAKLHQQILIIDNTGTNYNNWK